MECGCTRNQGQHTTIGLSQDRTGQPKRLLYQVSNRYCQSVILDVRGQCKPQFCYPRTQGFPINGRADRTDHDPYVQRRVVSRKNPNYIPQVSVYYLESKRNVANNFTLFGKMAHHSNGQDAGFYDSNGNINKQKGILQPIFLNWD